MSGKIFSYLLLSSDKYNRRDKKTTTKGKSGRTKKEVEMAERKINERTTPKRI